MTEVIREARAAYPKSDAYPGPTPFDPDALAADFARYVDDCAQLAKLPKVRFLNADAPQDAEQGAKPA